MAKKEPSRFVRARTEVTREAILEGAVDCIGALGIHRMTLTNVADHAKVSRGGLKYYYASIDDLLVDLYPMVCDRIWSAHENGVRARPEGQGAVDYAVGLIGMIDLDRYTIARMEIVTFARTTPALQAVVIAATAAIDARRAKFVDSIFEQEGVSSRPNFMAANDMSEVIADWLQVHPFAADRDHRIALVNRALRLSLYMLWKTPPELIEGNGPVTIDVAAVDRGDAG